jgi:hypothetical protein
MIKNAKGNGCIVSNKILKENYMIGYMYREDPNNPPDSGWRFLAGNEDEEYMNNANNFNIVDLQTICQIDKNVELYLNSNIGTSYIRNAKQLFELDDKSKCIYIAKRENTN